MNRLVSRSLEILGQATKETIGQEYASNLTTFINDAKNVKDSIVKSTTDASDTFAKLKTMNITKKISDWFYQEENNADASTGDEFDAGFKLDSSDDKKLDGDKETSSLTTDTMSNITEKQTGMMVKIGRRQAEQSIANTAEIVSVVNSRTSEMITSMNNINKSLIGINEKLDKLIKLQTIEIQENNAEDKSGIYDSAGNLSLMRIFEQAKSNMSNNTVLGTAKMLGQTIVGGGGPVDVAKYLMGFALGRPMDSLGGESIDSLGKKFNEMIGTGIQTGLNELIKTGPFKSLFGNLSQFEGDKDYGTIADNNYTTKKALFDGMTRMSIVNIIPEYLSKINQALSGELWTVDNRGRLKKGPVQNKFNEVTKEAFSSSGISSSAQNKILSVGRKMHGDKISSSDIEEAGKALCGVIVMYKHYNGNSEGSFSTSDLKKDMSPYIYAAVDTLCNIPGRNDPEYWYSVCQMIVLQLSSGLMDSVQFVRNVNTSLDNMKRSAIEIAKSGKPEALQAGKLSMQTMMEQFVASHKESDTQKTSTTTTTTTPTDGKVQRIDKYYIDGKHTSGDFIRGIFGILNRGINVKVLDKKDSSWKFDDYDLERQSVKQELLDNKAAELFGSLVSGEGNLGKLISDRTKQAFEELKNGGSTDDVIGGTIQGVQQGFMSNMMSTLGAASLRDLATKVVNGDYKGFFKEGGKGREILDNLKGNASKTFNDVKGNIEENIPAEVLYDKRTNAVKNAITGDNGLIDQGKGLFNKAADALSKNATFQKISGSVKGLVNNQLYKKDERELNKLNNLDTSAIKDFEDRMSAEAAMLHYKRGEFDEASIEANKIENKKLKEYFNIQINKAKEITEKRAEGQTALEESGTPDIGSVLQDTPDSITAITDKFKEVIDVVGGGFKKVGSILGKIAKFVGKLATKGVTDIVFGLKNMAGGLFGNKLRDSNGEVLHDENGNAIKSHGLVQNLTTDLWKLGAQGVKGVANKIGNMQLSRTTGDMTVREGLAKVKDKVLNTTFTGRYARDEEGNIKKDDNGKRQLENTSTIGDLLKKPGETLAKSISNISTDIKAASKGIKESKIGQLFKDVAKKIGNSKLGQAIDKMANWIKDKLKKDDDKPGLLKRAGQAFRNTRFGSGFMKGFDEAKAARDKLKKEKDRHESYTTETLGELSDVMTEEVSDSSKTSPFKSIWQSLKNILDEIVGFRKEIKEGDAAENTTETPEPTESTEPVVESEPTPVPSEPSGGEEGGGLLKGLKGLFGDIMGNIGQMMGGFTQALLGIGELVLSIVASMEGLQAIKDAVMGILTEGLEPLNEAFGAVQEAITPIIEALKSAVSSIAETVVVIVKTLIDVINPIMDAIMAILNPILEVINVLLDVIMMPILLTLDFLSPIIEGIGYTMKIVSGVLQLGMGIVIGILGSLLKGIGLLISAIGSAPIIGNAPTKELGASIESTADGMLDSSKSLISGGVEQMKEGISGIVALAKSIIKPADDETEKSEDEQKQEELAEVTLGGTDFGAGDVNTNTINNSWTYTYGSGNTTMNQHSYGGYMNMSERGCGPVVLADAYNRRNGGKMNPASLAASMMGSGTYDPRRGTSVGSMIDTGNAMGMGMRMGGVTQQSLKQASPSNPITVLGSGAGFGTKSGNNHYVNVVGTDNQGGAYVANPMSGRVERQSASNLALNSKLGLYGSGDDNAYEQYGFSDELSSSFEALRELTAQLTGIFQGPSKEDKINAQREEAKDAQNAKTIKQKLSDDEYAALEEQAMNQLKSDNPKRDGESDEDYEARINKLWAKKGNSLIVKLGGQQYADKVSEMADLMKSGAEDMQSAHDKMSEGMHAASGANLGASDSAKSDTGAIMAPYSPIKYTEPQIDGATSGKSPVHDFFSATSGSLAYTMDGGWFEKTNSPVSSEGVGSTGSAHEGIGITFANSDAEVHAITDGTVTYVGTGGKHGGSDPNGGLGNHVKWRDKSGMYHWYLHLNDVDGSIKEGANIEAGQLIGHVGSTGATGEGNNNKPNSLLRYILTKTGPYGSTGDDGYVNPLTYWKFEEGSNEELTGGSEQEQIFNYLVNNIGLSKKAAAGVMGVFKAESGLSAGTLEGYYAFDDATVKNATKDNASMDSYTTDKLFPMYYKSGVGISESGYRSSDGHYYPGFGLAQWTGGRGQLLMDYSKENSTDWRDLSTQLGLIKQELNGSYSYILDDLNSYGKDDVVKAADVWMSQYEAGGGKGNRNPSSTMLGSLGGIETRRKNAQAIYSEMENHVVPASTTTAADKKKGDEIIGRFVSTMKNDQGFSGDGFFISDGGVAMANYGTPSITSTNIDGVPSGNSPVHEFFSKTTNGTAVSGNANWFGLRDSPNPEGQGSSGSEHHGIDIWWSSGNTEGQELHAITGGVVDRSEGGARPKDGSNGGCGNNIRWLDDAGYLHWYMHMRDDPLFKAGDTIEPGAVVGYAGDTGGSDGAHLHYNINNSEGFGGWSKDAAVNPLTYFKNYNPSGGANLSGNSSGQNRGGFTNSKTQTNIYSGAGPYQFSPTGSNNLNKPAKQKTAEEKALELKPFEINNWKNYSKEQRQSIYPVLTKYHKQLTDGSSKKFNNGYYSFWGDYGDTDKEWMETYIQWKNYNDTSFGDQLADIKRYMGKGDVDDWGVSSYIPPIDMSKFDQYDSNEPIQQIFQKYEIVSDNSDKMKVLEKMSKMTFNVRAQRVEELLEELIEKVSGDKPETPPTPNTDGYDPDLFKNDIPEQVSRLARG